MKEGISRAKKKLILDKGTGILPKSLFIGFALGGALVIWILKNFGFSQFITVCIPVGCIVSYCTLAYKLDSFFLTEEKIGDNAYYLGFLYTLTSLSYALWMFSSGNNAPEYIIGSFGVALWSTIVGIACRVFFSQLRNDPNDIEKNARIRVAETASTLAAELHQATAAFNTYRRSLQQSIEEAFIDLNQKMDVQVAQSIESIKAVTASATDSINERHAQLNGTIEALTESSSRAVSSFDTMNNNMNACTKNIEGSVSELTFKVGKLSEQTTEIDNLSKNANTLSKTIHDLLKSFSSGLATVTDEQKSLINKMSDHANALEKQLERSRQYTNDTHQSLAQMTHNLVQKLR